MRIGTQVTFSAAHHLPHVAPGHKCARLHGHTYRAVVEVEGPVVEPHGWVMDLDVLGALLASYVVGALDHRLLNDRIPNPTAERITQWCWERLAPEIAAYGCALASITVHEGDGAWARAEGPPC